MSLDDMERDFTKKPRRTATNVILSIIAIAGVATLGTCAVRAIVNPAVQAGRVVERTIDADNVIRNYEWFEQQYQDIQAMDTRLSTARTSLDRFEESAGPRDTWRFDDRTEWNRLNTIVQGLEGQRAGMVADYNARAQMANRDIFRSDDLPEHIE